MAIVTKRTSVRLMSTSRLRIGVATGGGAFMPLPDAAGIEYSAGARSVQQVAFFGGAGAEVGAKTIEGVSIPRGSLLDHMQVYRALQRADAAGEKVRVRIDVYGYPIWQISGAVQAENTTVTGTAPVGEPAKAKGGLLTFEDGTDGTLSDVQQLFINDEVLAGDIITLDDANDASDADNSYIINRVEYDDDALTDFSMYKIYITLATGGDIAAIAKTSIRRFRAPGSRRAFSASIEQDGSFSGDASASPSLNSDLMLRPAGVIAPATLLLADEANSGW